MLVRGSERDPFNAVTGIGDLSLDSTNFYYDALGWSDASIDYYRLVEGVPCHTTLYQDMQIACGASPALTYKSYKHNELVLEIGVTTLTNVRDGVSTGPHTYP